MNIHQIIYRVGAVGISLTVLGVISYVVVFANSRQSGSTGVDAAKIMHMRYAAQEKIKAEQSQAESGPGERALADASRDLHGERALADASPAD